MLLLAHPYPRQLSRKFFSTKVTPGVPKRLAIAPSLAFISPSMCPRGRLQFWLPSRPPTSQANYRPASFIPLKPLNWSIFVLNKDWFSIWYDYYFSFFRFERLTQMINLFCDLPFFRVQATFNEHWDLDLIDTVFVTLCCVILVEKTTRVDYFITTFHVSLILIILSLFLHPLA